MPSPLSNQFKRACAMTPQPTARVERRFASALRASDSLLRRVSLAARSNSARASLRWPSFLRKSPRTLGSRW